MVIAVEDKDCRRGDGDPYREGIAGAAPVFPGHFEDIEAQLVRDQVEEKKIRNRYAITESKVNNQICSSQPRLSVLWVDWIEQDKGIDRAGPIPDL